MFIKSYIIITLLYITVYAKDIKPSFILKSSGYVNDFVIDGSKLYVANDEGSVEVFDLNKQKLIDQIFIKPTHDDLNNSIISKVLSIDRFAGKTLIVSSSVSGYRDVWIHDGKKLKHIIKSKNKMIIKKARFIDDKHFIFGTLGYDLIHYSTDDSSIVYTTHVEESTFSDISLSADKSMMITASESGRVTITDVKTGNILKKLESLNVDNIYKIAYKNGNIITAGEDRRVGIYPKNGKPYYIKSNFLVYCVAISPDGKTGIYSSGEDNNLQLFDLKTGKKIHKLIGQDAIPSTIKFFDEVGIFSAGYENTIYYWYID